MTEQYDPIVEGVKETAIQQTLDGLRRMPQLVARARQMAERDPVMKEALRRYDLGDW